MCTNYDVEIYSKGTLITEQIKHENNGTSGTSEESSHALTIADIIKRICYNLMKEDVKYDIILEELLKNMVGLLSSEIGSISVISSLIENDNSDKLICVALSEKKPGTILLKSNTIQSRETLSGRSISENKILISNMFN